MGHLAWWCVTYNKIKFLRTFPSHVVDTRPISARQFATSLLPLHISVKNGKITEETRYATAQSYASARFALAERSCIGGFILFKERGDLAHHSKGPIHNDLHMRC